MIGLIFFDSTAVSNTSNTAFLATAPTATFRVLAAVLCLLAGASASAASGKLLLTGGVSSIDGAAGGGLTPWAVIGSNATDGEVGTSAHISRLRTQGYGLTTFSAALGVWDRFEISLARQRFDTGDTGTALGAPGQKLQLDIVGLKLRVAGDAVLDSDTLMPQVAIGIESKRTDAGLLAPTLAALGADTRGTDVYLSATKLFLAQGLLVNATLRSTRANQNGLLGFGGTAQQKRKVKGEVSVAYLLNRQLAVGAEYRAKPDNLNPSILGAGLKEQAWSDVFVAWAPNKHLSLTLAWVDLGRVVPALAPKRQTGAYLSTQISF